MTDINQIKEATLAYLETIIEKQKFDAGVKQLRDKDKTTVFTFQTLPDNPDPAFVELTSERRVFAKDGMLKSGYSYHIRFQHSRKKAVDEPNDISLGITEEQFIKFLHLCCPDPKARPLQILSREHQLHLLDTCRLCAREMDSIREIRTRLDRFPLSLEQVHAANASLGASLKNIEEARTTLSRFLAGIEQDERLLEYHKRYVEDR